MTTNLEGDNDKDGSTPINGLSDGQGEIYCDIAEISDNIVYELIRTTEINGVESEDNLTFEIDRETNKILLALAEQVGVEDVHILLCLLLQFFEEKSIDPIGFLSTEEGIRQFKEYVLAWKEQEVGGVIGVGPFQESYEFNGGVLYEPSYVPGDEDEDDDEA